MFGAVVGWACPQNTVSEWADKLTRQLVGKRASVDLASDGLQVASAKHKAIDWIILHRLRQMHRRLQLPATMEQRQRIATPRVRQESAHFCIAAIIGEIARRFNWVGAVFLIGRAMFHYSQQCCG